LERNVLNILEPVLKLKNYHERERHIYRKLETGGSSRIAATYFYAVPKKLELIAQWFSANISF